MSSNETNGAQRNKNAWKPTETKMTKMNKITHDTKRKVSIRLVGGGMPCCGRCNVGGAQQQELSLLSHLAVISAGEVRAISISSLHEGETELSTSSMVSRSILVLPATSTVHMHAKRLENKRPIMDEIAQPLRSRSRMGR